MKNTFVRALLAATALVSASAVANAQECKVGISMYTLGAPYFAAQEATARRVAEEAGCTVASVDGQNDMVKQIGDIEDLISGGINILIIIRAMHWVWWPP